MTNILYGLWKLLYISVLMALVCRLNLWKLLNVSPLCRKRKVVYQITWDMAYLAPLAFYLKRPGFTRTSGDEAFWRARRAWPTIVTCVTYLYVDKNMWETSIYKPTKNIAGFPALEIQLLNLFQLPPTLQAPHTKQTHKVKLRCPNASEW